MHARTHTHMHARTHGRNISIDCNLSKIKFKFSFVHKAFFEHNSETIKYKFTDSLKFNK